MPTLTDLQAATAAFFSLHWPAAWGPAPQWSQRWDMQSGIENPHLPGAYALMRDDQLVYVGKGEQKAASGIARRLLAHVVRAEQRRGPYAFRKRWHEVGVTGIHTLSVDPLRQYLIPSLESYLIVDLTPESNRRR